MIKHDVVVVGDGLALGVGAKRARVLETHGLYGAGSA